MNIYYLYNSGFTVELRGDALIFDYYRGAPAKPWRIPVGKDPVSYDNIYVFASHAHGDHFNRVIFDWLSERDDIRYVLSDDIKPAVKAPITGKDGKGTVTYLGSGDSVRVGSLDIRAFGSTDAGVSFHVTDEGGTSLFHAGDFNYWHWSDESTPGEVADAYTMFAGILETIKEGIKKLDIAFFPVDPRMGGDYYRGAILFCEAMKPDIFIPMHFSSIFSPPDGFFKEIGAYTRVVQAGPGAGRLDI